MAARRGRIIVLAMATVLGFSLWRMVSVERERQRLAQQYTEAANALKQLENERSHLNDELVQTRQTVEGQAGQLGTLQQELQKVQGELKETLAEMTALQREHEELRRTHASLTEQFNSITVEKQQLEAKLSNLKELKLAIRDVKHKMWEQRWASWRAHIQAQKEADQEKLAAGNRGYVIRDRVVTLASPAKNKLQVHVLEPQPQ